MEFNYDASNADWCRATTTDVLARRDRVLARATALMTAGQVEAAVDVLRELAFLTIDATTLQSTDPFLSAIARGRRIVATFDPARTPEPDEIVIIYGNYPHLFENIIINNPVKRHVSDFWTFAYDHVEYDPRWERVERIFVINVDARRDRMDSVLNELARARAPFHRVERVSAQGTDPADLATTRGLIACLRSHIDAVKRAIAAGCEHALVLEDDFAFTSDLGQHLDDLRTFTSRHYDYWVCLLSTSKYGVVVPKDDLVSTSYQHCTNAGGYLLSCDGQSKVLEVFEEGLELMRTTGDLAYASDRYWSRLQQSGRFLVFRRKLGFQAASFSDIEGSISRYLD